MPVVSQKIYRWAFESSFSGEITPKDIADAEMQFRTTMDADTRGSLVWLLDANAATSVSMDILNVIPKHVSSLVPMGLGRIAVILPAIARPFASMINVHPVHVYPFNSRREAVEWLRRGCR